MSLIQLYFVPFQNHLRNRGVDELIKSYTQVPAEIVIKANEFKNIQKNNQMKDKSFYNKQNFYLKVIDLLKKYVNFGSINFFYFLDEYYRDFAKISENNNKIFNYVSNFLTQLQYWRRLQHQFQLIVWLLIKNDKILIKLYLKFRVEILRCYKQDFLRKCLPITNPHLKYSQATYQLRDIFIDMQIWSILIHNFLEGTKYDSKQNFGECLSIIRQILIKNKILEIDLRIDAIFFIEILIFFSIFNKSLFKSQKHFQEKIESYSQNPENAKFVSTYAKSLEFQIIQEKKIEKIDYTYRLTNRKQKQSVTELLNKQIHQKYSDNRMIYKIKTKQKSLLQDIRKFMSNTIYQISNKITNLIKNNSE